MEHNQDSDYANGFLSMPMGVCVAKAVLRLVFPGFRHPFNVVAAVFRLAGNDPERLQ